MRRTLGVLLGLSFSLLGIPLQAQSRSTPPTLSAEELFKRVSPAVFVVVSLDASNQPTEQGSAVVIRAEKVPENPIDRALAGMPEPKGGKLVKPALESVCYLITNYHVIKDGVSFQVQRGARKWPATLVATNPDNDVAELRVEKLDVPPVPLRPFSSLAIGEQVYAIGAPEGLELTLSGGLISSLRQSGTDRIIQTTAAISPGSSGGGLFDTSGRLVGITVAYLKGGQNLNFAIPTDWIASLHAQEWAELGSRAYQDGQDYDESNNDGLRLATKSYKAAADDYRQAVRLSPENAWFWSDLGDAATAWAEALSFSQQQPAQTDVDSARKEAQLAYQKAVQLDNDDENAWWGLVLYTSGEDNVNAWKNVIRLDPGNITAWEGLASQLCLLRRADDALTALATARALVKPHDANEELGLAYDYDACYLMHAVPQEPIVIRQSFAKFLEQALRCAQSAVKLQPNGSEAWQALGSVYSDMKDRTGVIKVYEKLKTLDPKAADEFFQQYVSPDH